MNKLFLFAGFVLFSSFSAQAAAIDCVKFGETLSINNSEILKLKSTTEDGTPGGAYVEGTFVKLYPTDDNGYLHFQMKIGSRMQDTIEVYYSGETPLPKLKHGTHLIVCGRYTTNHDGFYGNPKSPDGAYISQTSFAWSPYAEDGFISISGNIYN